MIYPPVRPGMPMRQVVTSRLINSLTQGTSPPQKTAYPTDDISSKIEIVGQLVSFDTNSRIEPFEPVLVRGPYKIPDPSSSTPNVVPTIALQLDKLADFVVGTHSWLPTWGIAQEAITTTRAGRVLLTGVSYLKLQGTIPSTFTTRYRAIDIVNGVMTYDYHGRAEILGNIANDSQDYCLVHLTRRYRAGLYFKTRVGGIAAGASALCDIVDPTGTMPFWSETTHGLPVWNPSTVTGIGASKRGVAIEYLGRWMAVFVEC